MKYKIFLLISCCVISNFVFAKDKSLQKFWIKHHYDCVYPYLEEIKATENYDRKKNRNKLVEVINNFDLNYERVYSENRTKHYIKQATALKNMSHKLYQDQIWHDKKNANTNLYVPEYCLTMLKYQLNRFHEVDIEQLFSDKDFVIDGFKEEAKMFLGKGLIATLSFLTDAMYSVVSLDGYRNSLKEVLERTYPKTHATCYENIEFNDDAYKKYASKINAELNVEYSSKAYQERLNQDKRKLDIIYDVLVNRTDIPKDDISKNLIRVDEQHDFYKLKEQQLSDMEGSINSANKIVNEFVNLQYLLISYMSKVIDSNPDEFSRFKDEYVCAAVARVHRNNGYLDGYMTPREMKKYHRDYYNSIK